MDLFSNDLETSRWSVLSDSTREALGQVYTPYPVARLMAAWLAPGAGDILDPAAGSGIFLRALHDPSHPVDSRRQVDSLDYDARMVTCLEEVIRRLPHARATAAEVDYFTLPMQQYGGVIVNPPYQYHGRLKNKEALQAQLAAETGVRLHGLSNLYVYFLLRLAFQVAPGGRMAALVPQDFLDTTYGQVVKQTLIDRGWLRGLISFEEDDSIFPGAMTTAVVVLLSMEAPPPGWEVSFLRASIDELAGLEPLLASGDDVPEFGQTHEARSLDPAEKWRLLFDGGPQLPPPGYVALGELARIGHGVNTGNNSYFVLRRSQVLALGLSRSDVVPCNGSSKFVPDPVFTKAQLRKLDAEDRPIWLLTLRPDDPKRPEIAAYLDSPAGQAARVRPATASRNPWYVIPRRPSDPIWISNLSRSRVKIVRNLTDAVTLDQFHVVRSRPELSKVQGDALVALLLGSDFAERVRHDCREYGGGLLKTQVSELNKLAVLDVRAAAVDDLVALAEAGRSYARTPDRARETIDSVQASIVASQEMPAAA